MSIRSQLIKLLILSLLLTGTGEATIYRFSVSGNDTTGDGSVATPYKTLGKLKSVWDGLSAGDKCLLKAGDQWNTAALWGSVQYLNLSTVSGSAGNYITLGAYDAAHPDGLVRTDSFTKPIINGDIDGDLSPEYPCTDVFATCYYRGLIVTGTSTAQRSYIRLENLHLKYSAGGGVLNEYSDYVVFHNFTIEHTQGAGIRNRWYADNCTAEYNTITGSGEGYYNCPTNIWAYTNWPAGIAWANYSDNGTIQYNDVNSCWTEGIDVVKQCDTVLVEGNRVYDVHSGHYYVDEALNVTFKDNLSFVSGSNTFTERSPAAFSLNSETNATISGIGFTGNIAINTPYGFSMGAKSTWGSSGLKVINNTFIYNSIIAVRVYSPSSPGTWPPAGSVFKNNVIYSNPSLGTAASMPSGSGITFAYNWWSKAQADVDADARGTGDSYGAAPGLTGGVTWTNLATSFDGSAAAPSASSNLVDKVDSATSNTLPLSGSTWPSSVTTADATTKYKSATPTGSSPSGTTTNPPTFTASAFSHGTSSTPVDFGAIQLNYGATHTASKWQIGNTDFSSLLSTTPATDTDDTGHLESLDLTASIDPNVTYYWRVAYKTGDYYTSWSTPLQFSAQPGTTPTGSGGAVLSAPGAGKGGATLTAPGAGKGGATLVGP